MWGEMLKAETKAWCSVESQTSQNQNPFPPGLQATSQPLRKAFLSNLALESHLNKPIKKASSGETRLRQRQRALELSLGVAQLHASAHFSNYKLQVPIRGQDSGFILLVWKKLFMEESVHGSHPQSSLEDWPRPSTGKVHFCFLGFHVLKFANSWSNGIKVASHNDLISTPYLLTLWKWQSLDLWCQVKCSCSVFFPQFSCGP